uniref:Uncharacterized protein n=1 Tax=viral metagenome TaxID=1070528 RepID=A0A6C0BC92_9ZZZZ
MSTEYYVDSPYTYKLKTELLFAWLYILFIFSWISIDVVGRALNNFTFKTLKLDENSTWDTSVIAGVVVILELVTIYYFKTIGMAVYDSSPLNDTKSQSDSFLNFDDFLNGSNTSSKSNNDKSGKNLVPSNISTLSMISNLALI